MKCSLKKIDLDVNSGPESGGQWKSICTWSDVSRTELLKCPGELVEASGAEQSLAGRTGPCTTDQWQQFTYHLLVLSLRVLVLHWPFLSRWANTTTLYQEVWAVPTDELAPWPSGAEGVKSFCPHPCSYKCLFLPSSSLSGNLIVQI